MNQIYQVIGNFSKGGASSVVATWSSLFQSLGWETISFYLQSSKDDYKNVSKISFFSFAALSRFPCNTYVFAHLLKPQLCTILISILLFRKNKIISVRHNEDKYVDTFYARLLVTLVNYFSWRIIYVSPTSKQFYTRKCLDSPLKSLVISNFYDLDFLCNIFSQVDERSSVFTPRVNPIFGSASRIIQQKNMFNMLDAYLLFNQKYISIDIPAFQVFGTGPQIESLTQFAIVNNINVVFHGQVPHIETIFNSIDIFVSFSNYEGSPMACLEALAYGKILVLSPNSSHMLLFSNLPNVFISASFSCEDLAETLAIAATYYNKRVPSELATVRKFLRTFHNDALLSFKELLL